MGTDMRMNATTFTLPTQYSDIVNASDRKLFIRTTPGVITFTRQVPRNLLFTNIADDSPTLPVPNAGSPGIVLMYGEGNVVSGTQTTIPIVTCTYILRGRI